MEPGLITVASKTSGLVANSVEPDLLTVASKTSGLVANSVEPDQTPRSAAADLSLRYLFRPVCSFECLG